MRVIATPVVELTEQVLRLQVLRIEFRRLLQILQLAVLVLLLKRGVGQQKLDGRA